MSKFSDALSQKDFLVTVEVDPPAGKDLGPLKELVQELAKKADAVVVSDNRFARAHLSPVLAAHSLVKHTDAAVIMTLTCRDRNRLALTGDLWAAMAGGVSDLLIVSGDHTTLGDQPGAKPVYDLDSVQALYLAAELAGADNGITLGATCAPAADPLVPQAYKVQKKLGAGAGFLISKALSDAGALGPFLEATGQLSAPLIAGVDLDGEVESAAKLIAAIKAGGLAKGVHLASPDGGPAVLAAWSQLGL